MKKLQQMMKIRARQVSTVVPVAFNSYDLDIPLRDRGCASAALDFVDLRNPLEGIAKLCIQTDVWGTAQLLVAGVDQSYEIKPGATNKFTRITPDDPNDSEYCGSSDEVEIKCEDGNIIADCDGEYFIFTFTDADLEIILATLGLEDIDPYS